MSTVDDRLFSYLVTRLDGYNNIATLDAEITRDDWPLDMRSMVPRVEYNPWRARDDDVRIGGFGLTIYIERGDAYGTGNTPQNEGKLEQLETDVVARVTNVRPTGVTGFGVSTIGYEGRRRPTISNEDIVSRRLDFTLTAIPGGSAPLAGTDGDLSSAGITGEVISWQIRPQTPLDFDFTAMTDTVGVPTTGDPSATGTIDVVPTTTSTPFPTVGSTISATFQTESGVSWTDNIVIYDIDRITIKSERVQIYRISFATASSDSPVFGGAVP